MVRIVEGIYIGVKKVRFLVGRGKMGK